MRTLEISVEDIRKIMSDQATLTEVIEKQVSTIQTQIEGLSKAESLCERMPEDADMRFDDLQVEKYVTDMETYWEDHSPVFRLGSVGFLYLWGSLITWAVITSLCLFVGIASYTRLPPEIPVQWDHGTAVSFAGRPFIFLFPAACVMIRLWLRPIIYAKWLMHAPYAELIREYLSNSLCFIALSLELFVILFVHGMLKSIVAVLLADTVALIGLLIAGMTKIHSSYRSATKKQSYSSKLYVDRNRRTTAKEKAAVRQNIEKTRALCYNGGANWCSIGAQLQMTPQKPSQ